VWFGKSHRSPEPERRVGQKILWRRNAQNSRDHGVSQETHEPDAVRNTKLIGITVYSEDKNDAARLANAIADAYRDYRLHLRRQLSLNGIKVLEDRFQSDGEQIQAIQTNVDNLRKELGVNDSDPNSMLPTPTLSQEQVRNYNAMRLEGETHYMKLEKEVTQLQY